MIQAHQQRQLQHLHLARSSKNTYIGDANAAFVVGDGESILGGLGGVDEGEVLLVGPFGGSVLVHGRRVQRSKLMQLDKDTRRMANLDE